MFVWGNQEDTLFEAFSLQPSEGAGAGAGAGGGGGGVTCQPCQPPAGTGWGGKSDTNQMGTEIQHLRLVCMLA